MVFAGSSRNREKSDENFRKVIGEVNRQKIAKGLCMLIKQIKDWLKAN